ncbi:D-lactate dehydrogenase [cytochrome], mitochondrial-like isoform X2 [Nymphaea colorata]|uniref:D-lactate dehydrogenase [cytochrome], mitochondrial-like isoform X2 n=1 Tax=Nymphaea colorata TaxID=210225 RepID=UPI00214E9ED9|nr:D-lactate dehydrogenase [cytochrome], mitochondrial-like isoform X2 [Nymphaea colorata]
MAFRSWFSRFSPSHRHIARALSAISSREQCSSLSETLLPKRSDRRFPWLAALPMAVALASGAAALDFVYRDPSLCESSQGLQRVGGKESGRVVVEGHPRRAPQELIDELKLICDGNLTLDYEERDFHGKPQHSFHRAVNIPDVVVYPRTQEEVSKIVKACNKYKVPIVPYGGATSIEGHTLSPFGGVCIDMAMMKKIKSLHVEDMDVVVEPGIGWMELNEFLKPYGLFFPLDPGPGASIGGMCATRCSGSLAVRYGTMRDNVINLQVVLANGDVVKTASRARKSAAGYDLTRLLIGSEGTLGVITEVTLRLQKLPAYSVVAMCHFPTIKDAADVAIATMLSGIQVSRVELLDEVQVKAINFANGKNLPEAPTLMFEFVGTEAYSREQTLLVQKVVAKHNGSNFVYVEDPEAKKELWRIRKEALWACLAMRPDYEAMTTDVCVPLSRLAECISRSKVELDASPLLCMVIAHAGDGNFHTVILFDPKNEEHRQEAERLSHFMVHTALSMEGTCTGEHGVGTGKMKLIICTTLKHT